MRWRVPHDKRVDVLRTVYLNGEEPYLDPSVEIPLVHIIWASAVTGRPVGEICEAYVLLGFRVGVDAAMLRGVSPVERSDLVLLDLNDDEAPRWPDPANSIAAGHLVEAAVLTERSVKDVVGRFISWGYHVAIEPDTLARVAPVMESDAVLLSCNLDGMPPWRDPPSNDELIPLVHLVRAAAVTGLLIEDVVERFSAWGYEAAVGLAELAQMGQVVPSDITLLSRDLDGQWPWLLPAEQDQPFTATRVGEAAVATGQAPGEVARRYKSWGFMVEDSS